MSAWGQLTSSVIDRVGRVAKAAGAAMLAIVTSSSGPEQHPFGMHLTSAVAPVTEWTVDRVRNALTAHERGDFRESAVLCDHFRRDARLFATLESRVLASLGGERLVEPSHAPGVTSKRLARALAADVESWFFEFLPESTQADLLRWAILMGFAVGELTWERSDPNSDRVYPKCVVHHPQHVRYDQLSRKMFLRLKAGGETEITPGDGRWVMFSLGSGQNPWMHGAVRALAIPWMVLTFVVRDWARREEIEATGVRVASVPADYNDKKVKKFLRQIARLGKETALTLPAGYDFKFLTVDTGAADGFAKLADRCDTGITLVLLGQNLTTQIEGGSFAAAQTHAKVQLERVKADVAALATCLRYQVLMPWGAFNFTDWRRDYTPWVLFDTRPPEDKQKEAQALLTLAQALPALYKLGVDLDPIFEKFGLKLVDDEVCTHRRTVALTLELSAANVISMNEARARIGYPPAPWGNVPIDLIANADQNLPEPTAEHQAA